MSEDVHFLTLEKSHQRDGDINGVCPVSTKHMINISLKCMCGCACVPVVGVSFSRDSQFR